MESYGSAWRDSQTVNLRQGDTHRRVSGNLTTSHPSASRQTAEVSFCDEHGKYRRVVGRFQLARARC
jgi:hypothetical protein